MTTIKKELSLLDGAYKLKITKFTNDAGNKTLTILLRGQDKNKDSRFFYFNNGKDIKVFERPGVTRRKVSGLREAKFETIKHLTKS